MYYYLVFPSSSFIQIIHFCKNNRQILRDLKGYGIKFPFRLILLMLNQKTLIILGFQRRRIENDKEINKLD